VANRLKARQRPTKVQQRAEQIEQILDAAEYLFSKHGLYGVTLKDVARRVGAHHTLLNYYFVDKKKLFDAVFARRAVVTSTRRMAALEAYDAQTHGRPSVEGALRAFLDTDLDLYIQGGEGWRNYGALGAQVANTPKWGAEIMHAQFDPVVLRLIELLKKALPGSAAEDIFWSYHFVTGALMLTLARTGRIDMLSGGLCKSEDFAAVKERMASFMADGLKKAIELNQIIGSRYIIMASPPGNPTTVDGWKNVANVLNTAVEKLKPLGMSSGYHNHQLEWKPVEGQRPMDVLARNTVQDVVLQFDVGTCVEVGEDPIAWINANPGRIKSVHCKDWAPGEDKGYTVLFGEGAADWKGIFAAAESVGGIEYYLVEQEGSRFSEFETAKKCLETFRRQHST
jgi:AcrR family transcriptional regulator